MEQSYGLIPQYVLIVQATVLVFILSPGFSSQLLRRIKRLWENITQGRPGKKTLKYHVIDMSEFK